MRDTAPPPPVGERATNTLVEDLCFALRDVGVFDSELPGGPRVVAAIENVRTIVHELALRCVDVRERLNDLTEQTRWRMNDLLKDCLAYPDTLPYVKELDGIRRCLRCTLCQKAERPHTSKQFWMCDGCIGRIVESIRHRKPINGIVLFRTYNVDSRCEHADSETVLAAEVWNDTIFGNCEQCFKNELMHRVAHPAG
jgi:hypothetical protein